MKHPIAALALLLLPGCIDISGIAKEQAVPPTAIVIAHRGASGERPEHTLAAYRLAIQQGADFIEPDLVMTKDGVLVARHENEISETTDVATRPEFAARRRTQSIDGQEISGWFTEDFTLSELKTLRAKERLPQLRPQNTAFDGQEAIPTFAEVLALANEAGVGVYPETKHPSHFAAQGLDLNAALLRDLAAAGLAEAKERVFIQSFEVGNLERLAKNTKLPLVQLIAAEGGPPDRPGQTYAAMLSDAGLRRVARYAAGIGVEKALLLPRDAEGRSVLPTDLADRAHKARLQVHAWTFRAENAFLPLELRRGAPADPGFPALTGDVEAELRRAFLLGADGVFTDFPARGVAARQGAAVDAPDQANSAP